MTKHPRNPSADPGGPLTFPLLLAVGAPVAVVISLEHLHSIWWAFATYQVGICLLAPIIESRLAGRSWRGHAEMLGLVRPRESTSYPRLPTLAIALGLASLLITGAFLLLTRDSFLAADRIESTVAGWGLLPDQALAMLAFMALLNGPAEELFWRGYLPGRVGLSRPASKPSVVLTIFLPAILYTSYHVATIGHLVGKTGGVLLMTGGILGSAIFWGWLRRRTGSVWPALLSHSGGVLAYMGVHQWLTG